VGTCFPKGNNVHYHADTDRQYNKLARIGASASRKQTSRLHRRVILTRPTVDACLLVSHDAHGVHRVREDHWYAFYDDRQQLQFHIETQRTR
jgi:hypothetical protein